MRKFFAFLLLMTASGAAVYHYQPSDQAQLLADWVDGARSSASAIGAIVQMPARPIASEAITSQDPDTPRTFSPQRPLFARLPATPQGAEPPPGGDAKASAGPIVAARPSPDETRRALVRDLQRELKRVGCYHGEITGDWSAPSQQAMRAFTERVNARLPLDNPDYILLTLVKGHAAEACSKSCPVGQVQAAEGKCVPRGLMAKAPKWIEPSTAVSTRGQPTHAETEIATKPSHFDQVRKAERQSPPERTAKASSWSVEVLPGTRETTAVATIAPEPRIASVPLAGRMTLGASPVLPPSRALTSPEPDIANAPLKPLGRDPRAFAGERKPAGIEPNRVTAAPASEAGTDGTEAAAQAASAPLADTAQLEKPAPKRTRTARRSPASDAYRPPSWSAPYNLGAIPPVIRPAPRRHWTRTIFSDVSRMH